jgi:chromosome segregation ATPase
MSLDFPTIGGATGFAAAAFYSLKLVLDWMDKRRHGDLAEKQQEVAEITASVSDAATTNALILNSLQASIRENERLHQVNAALVEQNRVKDERIDELQLKINRNAQELLAMNSELEALRSKPQNPA